MDEVIYEAENVQFKYNKERQELYQKWDQFIRPEVFRTAIDELVNLIDKHVVYYIISDTKSMVALSPKEGDYASQVMPAIFNKGVKFMAFILPDKTLGKMAVNRFTNINSSKMNIGHFADINEARKWVDENRF